MSPTLSIQTSMADCGIGHKPPLLHVSGWDIHRKDVIEDSSYHTEVCVNADSVGSQNRGPTTQSQLHRFRLKMMAKMAAPVSRIFWPHFCRMGQGCDLSSMSLFEPRTSLQRSDR